MSEARVAGGNPPSRSVRRRPPFAAVGAVTLVAAVAIALFAWRSLGRTELLDPRDLVGENTAVVLSVTVNRMPEQGDAPGILDILERMNRRDAAGANARLPKWAGWLISGGAAAAVLPGRVLLAWDAPEQRVPPAGDPALRPVIALSLSRLPEGLASLVVGQEPGAWTSLGHTLLFTPDPASPLEVARRLERRPGGGPAAGDPILAALGDTLDPRSDGWLVLHNGSDRLERFALASLARRGLGGLRFDGTSVVNGRIVPGGFEGAAVSFRLDGSDAAAFTGRARFRDAASAASGRDWLQRAIKTAASLSGVEVTLDLGAATPGASVPGAASAPGAASVPVSGRAVGLDRLWERMLGGRAPGS